MPASWPSASAQLRQVALTGQPRQISLAVLTWARADLMSPSGKNSSGSASRQAASSRQSGRWSQAGLAAAVDVLIVLAFIPAAAAAARTNSQPCALIGPLTVVRGPGPVQIAEAPHGRGDLPDRDDAVQRAGQHGGLIRAAGVGLLEAEAGRARTGFRSEAQRADRNEPGTIRCQPSASRTATTVAGGYCRCRSYRCCLSLV